MLCLMSNAARFAVDGTWPTNIRQLHLFTSAAQQRLTAENHEGKLSSRLSTATLRLGVVTAVMNPSHEGKPDLLKRWVGSRRCISVMMAFSWFSTSMTWAARFSPLSSAFLTCSVRSLMLFIRSSLDLQADRRLLQARLIEDASNTVKSSSNAKMLQLRLPAAVSRPKTCMATMLQPYAAA